MFHCLCIKQKNSCGKRRKSLSYFVNVSDKPSEPQNLKVTEVTKESVGLAWEAPESNGGMEISQYVVEKRDASKTGWIQAATIDGRTTSCVVGKLYEGNDYFFRVYAENKIGTGPPAELTQPITAKLPYGMQELSSRLYCLALIGFMKHN